MTDQKALEYLDTFPVTEKVDLKNKYPAVDGDCLDFLNRVLIFNPYFRISVDECLNHPLFTKVRQSARETSQTQNVVLDFEKEDLNRERLRELILQEASFYK